MLIAFRPLEKICPAVKSTPLNTNEEHVTYVFGSFSLLGSNGRNDGCKMDASLEEPVPPPLVAVLNPITQAQVFQQPWHFRAAMRSSLAARKRSSNKTNWGTQHTSSLQRSRSENRSQDLMGKWPPFDWMLFFSGGCPLQRKGKEGIEGVF